MKLHRKVVMGGFNQAWDVPTINTTTFSKIAFTVTTSDSLAQIKVWLAYHRAIGVSEFYLFVDGQASSETSVASLRQFPDVTVIIKDEELDQRNRNSRIWNETWLSAFFNKPCNHELFVTQSLNMAYGIELARSDGLDWILHVDTDELIYPGGSTAYSLQQVLAQVPPHVDLLVFPNYEALSETSIIDDPFTQVSLFKKNFQHVESNMYYKKYSIVAKGNPNYFTTYGNGKSAARVIDGLRPNGAHRWHNYVKNPVEWTSDQSAVLHYTYNRYADLKSRRDRCDCQPTEEDASRCFILPFDRLAFLEASLKSEDELLRFYKERLVWDDSKTVNDLLKSGLFARLYEPQILVRGISAAQKLEATHQFASTQEESANETVIEKQKEDDFQQVHNSGRRSIVAGTKAAEEVKEELADTEALQLEQLQHQQIH